MKKSRYRLELPPTAGITWHAIQDTPLKLGPSPSLGPTDRYVTAFPRSNRMRCSAVARGMGCPIGAKIPAAPPSVVTPVRSRVVGLSPQEISNSSADTAAPRPNQNGATPWRGAADLLVGLLAIRTDGDLTGSERTKRSYHDHPTDR